MKPRLAFVFVFLKIVHVSIFLVDMKFLPFKFCDKLAAGLVSWLLDVLNVVLWYQVEC